MPGVASIKWTDENMVQALYAFIYYGAVKVEDDVAEKVAAHLGNSCTPTAIHNLIRTRRASFKPGVMPPPAAPESTPTKGRKRKNASEATTETPKKVRKTTKKATKKSAKQVSSDIENDFDDDDDQDEPFPPVNEEEVSPKFEDGNDDEEVKTEVSKAEPLKAEE